MSQGQPTPFRDRAPRGAPLWVGFAQGFAVLAALVSVTVLVYLSGTESISIHLFYIPIIYAGYAFGDYGAIITSLFAAALTAHGAPARILPDGTAVPQGDWDPAIRAAVFFIIAMASSRASLELRRRATEFRTLYEVAQSISSTLRLRQVLELIVNNALTVIDAKGCAIRLYNETTGELELVAMRGLSDAYWRKGSVKLDESPIDQRAMGGEPVQVQDISIGRVFQYPEEARQEGIRAVLTVPLRSKDATLGVIRVYSAQRRRFSRREVALLTAFANQAAVAIENAQLYEDIRRNYYETVRALTAAIEAQDRPTYSHSERVTELTEALAIELGLSPEEVELVRFGAILHDIGKITLHSDERGLSPSADPMHDTLYRMHPIVGASILQPISFLQPVLCMVKYHHERWDGRGFPEGLQGKDIPFYARMVAVTDAYERLINPREGQQRLEPREAIANVVAEANSAFDPEIVVAFRRLVEKRPDLAMVPEMSRPLLPPRGEGALGQPQEDRNL
ncbi:MAG: HD domain-containing protein [Armatimonadetes bacterium]|nr:HD domain-containing protein [Armatimonadota bacterium]